MTTQLERPTTVSEVVDWIAQSKLLLPAIQREYEWKADQVVALFDSLMRDYPIGSFLFWKVNAESSTKYCFYKFLPYYHERDKRHNEAAAITTPYELTVVLDGQQRLTSLFIALASYRADKLPYKWWKSPDAYPEKRLYLNLRKQYEESDDIDRHFDFRFLTASEAAQNDDDQFWFPVGQALKFGSGNELLANTMAYAGATPQVNSSPFAMSTLSKLVTIINAAPVINYFQEREQKLDHVLNVFIRLNSGGSPLSYSDLLLSVATAQWKGDARQAIHGLVDELNKVGGNQFNFDADFVLKSTLVLTDRPNVRFEVDNFDRDATAKMESMWESSVRTPLLRAPPVPI